MALNIANFVKTTLRAPLRATDTHLQLAIGSGLAFNFTVGDYCYLTLEDRSTHEVVKYTSSGVVVGDNIPVLRGQDGSTPRAFPAGTCVTISWNEAQITDLIQQVVAALTSTNCPPTNTMLVTLPPTSAPTGCVQFAVNTATTPWTFYYWSLNAWHLIGMPSNTLPTSVSISGNNLVVTANGSTSSLPMASLCAALSSIGCSLGGSGGGGGTTTNSLTVTSTDVVSVVNGITASFSLTALCSALANNGCSSLGNGAGAGLSGSLLDVTSGKTGFSTYTNTYGKVISVYVRSINQTGNVTYTVAGLTRTCGYDANGYPYAEMLVPAGATYSFNDGNAFVAAWYELR